jgi:putative nucleotidyltransferase with HDIG domain
MTPAIVDALIADGQAAERQARRDDARQCFEGALRALRSPEHASVAAALLRWIAGTYVEDADVDAALDCCEASLAVATACEDGSAAAHAVNLMAVAHWQCGRLDDAERLFADALARAGAAGEGRLGAMIEQNLGVIASIRGDLSGALGHYEKALAACRTLSLESLSGRVLNNMGMVYTDLRRWDDAERAYREASESSVRSGDQGTRLMVEVNRAAYYIARRDYDRARHACEVAYAFARDAGAERELAEIDKYSGVVAREMGEQRQAEERLLRARRIAEERGDLLLAAESARELAELFWSQQRSRETLQHFNVAHRLFGQLRARRALADVDGRIGRLEETFMEIVERWSNSIESADAYTGGHCDRVAAYACTLAEAAGLDRQSLFWFRTGALLHDVGKIVVPLEVLNKPGKLTDEEFEVMKRHAAAGEEMLHDVDFPWDVKPMVRHHHEQWGGTGYPDRLAGEAIPFAARILCIADVYDALTSDRPYRAAFSQEKAISIMTAEAGRSFDPELFPLFLKLCAERPDWPLPTAVPDAAREAGPGADGSAGAGASALVLPNPAPGGVIPARPLRGRRLTRSR